MVVAYRTSGTTWALAKRLVRVPFVSLPNLIANARVVPEHLQDESTPARLARDLLPLLEEGEPREAQLRAFRSIRDALGASGVADRVADLALALMEARA